MVEMSMVGTIATLAGVACRRGECSQPCMG